jgi:hypothetical protein
MGVQLIRRPADGGLPFINANGHGIRQVMHSLKRFSQVANGGEIADSVHLNPVQVQEFEHLAVSIINFDSIDFIKLISDTRVLPSEGVLYKGDKLLATIRNISIPIAEEDKLLTPAQHEEIARTHFLKSS